MIYAVILNTGYIAERFSDINARAKAARTHIEEIIYRHDAIPDRWISYGSAWNGNVIGLFFASEPNMLAWKHSKYINNGYTPRQSTRLGKRIKADLEAIEGVPYREIDEVFGYDSDTVYRIGRKEYFGNCCILNTSKYIGVIYPCDTFKLPDGGRVVSEQEFNAIMSVDQTAAVHTISPTQ